MRDIAGYVALAGREMRKKAGLLRSRSSRVGHQTDALLFAALLAHGFEATFIIHFGGYHRHLNAEDPNSERQGEIIVDHGEEPTCLFFLIVPVDGGLFDQLVQLRRWRPRPWQSFVCSCSLFSGARYQTKMERPKVIRLTGTPRCSTGHAGACASPKLTFDRDHSTRVDQSPVREIVDVL